MGTKYVNNKKTKALQLATAVNFNLKYVMRKRKDEGEFEGVSCLNHL